MSDTAHPVALLEYPPEQEWVLEVRTQEPIPDVTVGYIQGVLWRRIGAGWKPHSFPRSFETIEELRAGAERLKTQIIAREQSVVSATFEPVP